MTDIHHEIRILLTDFNVGYLDPGQREQVERHLRGCNECREFARRSEDVLQSLRTCAKTEQGNHVSEELLCSYSDEPDRVGSEARDVIETHLLFCESCSRELELLTEITSSLKPETASENLHGVGLGNRLGRLMRLLNRPTFAYGLAAALILLLGYPAIRYVTSPTETAHLIPPELRAGTVVRLSELTRTINAIPEVQRRRGDDIVRLTLTFWLDNGRNYGVVVRRQDGSLVTQGVLSDEDIRQGDTYIELQSALLTDGKHSLVLQGVSQADPSDTLETVFPFLVRTVE